MKHVRTVTTKRRLPDRLRAYQPARRLRRRDRDQVSVLARDLEEAVLGVAVRAAGRAAVETEPSRPDWPIGRISQLGGPGCGRSDPSGFMGRASVANACSF